MKNEAFVVAGFGELKVHVRILKNGNPVTRSSSKASYGEVIPQGGK
jgi:hypothetical protein